MKQFVGGLAFLFLSLAARSQVSIDVSGGLLQVKTGKIVRLINGTGFVDLKQKGSIKKSIRNQVVLLTLLTSDTIGANQFAGVFFDTIPQLKKGIAIWRYKPWNSWTKPIAISDATKMQEWDVQFFYWQYQDGLYGAAVPLSGNGYRTTLGSEAGKWGSKAVSYVSGRTVKEIPCMAIAFGQNPYELFARIYQTALETMGAGENEFSKKVLPVPLQYIGWCTWNSSNLGHDLNDEHIIEGVKTFTDKKFPLGWILIDDGWFQHQHSQLRSLLPDPVKFPNGFKPLIHKLKTEYEIKYAGVWHAFNGYWNGIAPASPLGIEYKEQLFSWRQPERIGMDSSPVATYYFIKPEADNLYHFYDKWHQYLKKEGFDFVKVDNQLVVERMAINNYPIMDLSHKMHEALYKSVNKNFKGAVINCMDMTADAYWHFGTSATARTVEDYFPYEKDETYNLQKGNAAAHILQAIYNSIYFSQMVFTDYDMFQSHHPAAILHALARTLNNGPIYLTDKPGEQNFDILNKIIFSDGRSIRSQTSLLPSKDCLFQLQDKQLFKAFSKVGKTGLLLLLNLADADTVKGSFSAADVEGVQAKEFAMYEYFSGRLRLVDKHQSFELALPRMGYQLHYVVPVEQGFAAFGLIDKYNAPATILGQRWIGNIVNIQLYEGGNFKAYCKARPKKVLVNGKAAAFSYNDRLLDIDVPAIAKKPTIQVVW